MSTTCLLQNPVLTGFHPDPSVCRVGRDCYLDLAPVFAQQGARADIVSFDLNKNAL